MESNGESDPTVRAGAAERRAYTQRAMQELGEGAPEEAPVNGSMG
jgi:hypothetical protein